MSEYRPNPDAILQELKSEHSRQTRGRLKVFFGMCPGVGKTYAMLKAAQEMKRNGMSVTIGIVETHGRVETESMLEGLNLMPRRRPENKSASLSEFDLDLALVLKPELILVDELAHSNAEGSRHPKRYQDVQELLAAGINVYTTVNVQHIESRNDLVLQMTGVSIREKVPDSFFESANEIEMIDITPEVLLKRLRDGKVYLEERAETAAKNFFKEETIHGLRELALRFTAELVDDKLKGQMILKGIEGPWNTQERLLVAVSHSPLSARLIRTTRRMAFSLEAPWVALHVDTGHALSEENAATLKKNLDMARELGAEVIDRKDHSIPSALMHVAREKNVTQIIMGRPDRRPVKDFLSGGTLLDQLVNEASGVDVHVIRQKRAPRLVGFSFALPESVSGLGSYLKTLIYMVAVSALYFALLPWVGYRAIGFGFLLSFLPIAVMTSFGPTVFAAGMSALIWDFCFIPPQFTFAIHESQDIMMIFAYFAVAMVAGLLARKLRKQEAALIEREYRSGILYEFEKKLVRASTAQAITENSAETIQQLFEFESVVFLKNQNGELADKTVNGLTMPFDERDRAVAHWSFGNCRKAGKGTDTLPYANCLCYPLLDRSAALGVLMIYPTRTLLLNEENLLETISSNLAAALEKENLEVAARRTQMLEQSEKMHQTLLNSVSHELRTPLTSIMGISSALQTSEAMADPKYRAEIVQNLKSSSERLKETIDNVLDMTRLSTGVLQIERNFFELHDFVKSYMSRARVLYPEHELSFKTEGEDIIVRGDEKLLESALSNLVSNAAKYSDAGKPIEIVLDVSDARAQLKVIDEGTGIDPGQIELIFERFYRASVKTKGLGLGLTIAKAIVESHGGSLIARNRIGHAGMVFTLSIPVQDASLLEGLSRE